MDSISWVKVGITAYLAFLTGQRCEGDVLYGDSGSAARFFKECKETDEEWLERLGLANTVGSSLSLKNERAVSVLNHVATGALPEGRQSSVVKAPSMSVTPSELRQLIESVIIMIQNIETACWQGPLPTKNILLPTGARYAAHQAQTGTMTTTLSHWKSGGSADPVTFNITPSNMEAGGRDWPRRAFYCAKASKAERTCGGKVENGHPTVKPLALMRYLVRLVKMPHGTIVMDPFAGSGTTGAACKLEGCDFIGCETDEKSFITAQQRYNATPEPLL